VAYRKARRGKLRSPAVSRFGFNLETELFALEAALLSGEYRPSPYRLFKIFEPKSRIIAAAPFVDRVVHHALMRVIEPLLDPRIIHDSYACRVGKGAHRAVDRYQHWSKRYTYALQMDIRQYFPSIDRGLVKQKYRRYIKDKQVLNLFDLIIDSAPVSQPLCYLPEDKILPYPDAPKGLPIGNLTSQFLANLYLNEFDHFVKQTLGCHAYLRYMDDFIILGDNVAALKTIREQVRQRLLQDRVHLHPRKAHIVPTQCGLNVLGYLVYPHTRRLRNVNGYRFARKLRGFARAYQQGRMDWADFNPSVQSWIGHAQHADTIDLREKLFCGTVFQRIADSEQRIETCLSSAL